MDEELFAHGPWLRRLASSLARGDADAEDLVQETWIAALRSPPATDRPVRPWLGTVLTNALRMRARATRRRVTRESASVLDEAEQATAASAPAAAPPDDLLERLESHAFLTRLVGELDEPLRRVLYLRYYEGLTAADIARAEKIPAGTVRWRLKTALDRLRARLDAEAGGDRRQWALLFVPLKGAYVMKRNSLVAAVVLALLGLFGGAFVLMHRSAQQSPDAALATTPTTTTAPAMRAPANAEPAAAQAGTSAAAAPVRLVRAKTVRDPSLAAGAIEGRVVDWGDGGGVAGAEVTFAHDGASLSVTSKDGGAFAFAPPEPGEYRLAVVTAPGYLPFAPEWDASPIHVAARPGVRVEDVAVYLVPALDYHGLVVDARGAPVAGATVKLLGAAAGQQALHPIADTYTTDTAGAFVFHAPDDAVLEAKKEGVGRGRAMLAGGALSTHKLTITLAGHDGHDDAQSQLGASQLAGRVVGPDGVPLPGALVVAQPADTTKDPGEGAVGGEALAGDDGRFALTGLDPAAYRLRATFDGYAAATAKATASAHNIVLTLGAGASIAGRVTDAASGAPIPAFTVAVTTSQGMREELVEARSVIDADGAFKIGDLAPGAYHVEVAAHGYAPSGLQAATASVKPASISVTLASGGKLVGFVTDAATHAPLTFAKVSVESGAAGVPVVESGDVAITGDDGRFELEGMAAGQHSIVVGAGDHHPRIVSGLVITDGATLGPIAIELTAVKEGENATLELVGIGAKLSPGDDAMIVEGVLPDGGAEAAGLAHGDAILAVDGTAVTTLGMAGTIEHIRGPEGTVVTLKVRKAGATETSDVAVTRKKISM